MNDENMDNEFLHEPQPPAREGDQDMGLLSLLDACPVLSAIMCEGEGEDFEETMET